MDERTVITIGREFGSGGHEIGKTDRSGSCQIFRN